MLPKWFHFERHFSLFYLHFVCIRLLGKDKFTHTDVYSHFSCYDARVIHADSHVSCYILPPRIPNHRTTPPFSFDTKLCSALAVIFQHTKIQSKFLLFDMPSNNALLVEDSLIFFSDVFPTTTFSLIMKFFLKSVDGVSQFHQQNGATWNGVNFW